ncbi:unnamed protein product [Lepeophtheirus salmonis]|uniref:(salmon louse) hypothetical protein n=1 Tax=Lepeophtheirus salmonis TaxID=72036 RepID=A0A7R8D6L7_LEPSM|nr:unnamed protein product [Lepeophtheirus salmonis]CAF3017223.1 unnamed protein product [Lepeophtheirus salmonis]
MALNRIIFLVSILTQQVFGRTCPGFPGYCSESFPGQTCVVVCSRGRNNVPLCQEDGTWTDIPRCIEHEPGVDEQIPGICPGISGYCSEAFLGQRCQFKCSYGGDIDSICSPDGTWDPYPKCLGDIRESQDGCDPCPGPVGRSRNRTLEAIYRINDEGKSQRSLEEKDNRRPVPTFSGTQRIGPLAREEHGTLFRSTQVESRNIEIRPHSTSVQPRPPPPPSNNEDFPIFSSPRQSKGKVQTVPMQRDNPIFPPQQIVTDVKVNVPQGPHFSEPRRNGPPIRPIFENLENSFLRDSQAPPPSSPLIPSASELRPTRFIFKNGKIGRIVAVNENGELEPVSTSSESPVSPPVFQDNRLPRAQSSLNEEFFGPFQIFDPNAQTQGISELKAQATVPQRARPGGSFGPFSTINFSL